MALLDSGHASFFSSGAGVRTQVLMLTQEAHYLLSCLLTPGSLALLENSLGMS